MTFQPVPHSSTMETSECFMFVKLCTFIYVFGNIGKYNPPSIVDLVISSLGNFALILVTHYLGGQILQ